MKVIIGAGPAGLYTAIKLRKAGIKDIVVIDPHGGKYTRPGHLDVDVFIKAQVGIGISFWPGSKGHIKDLERKLWIEAEKLGIRIHNQSFVRLSQEPEGVIVTDGQAEEFIPADYVFDCTGAKRAVVNNLNTICPESPLKLKSLTEVPVPNHFIAYVNMSETDKKSLDSNIRIVNMDPLEYVHLITKLRSFGWNELKFPRCYGATFGKKSDKTCVYLQTPPNLSPARYTEWFETIIKTINPDITYTHVKPSQKFTSKPRFNAFTLTANALEQVAYKGKKLPHVIALGDAQIDPNYYLAHGIYNGMKRINDLFKTFEIIDGKICYFDAEEYQLNIAEKLKKHQTQLLTEAKVEKLAFRDALNSAALRLQQLTGIAATTHTALLTEIEARQSYHQAQALFAECHSSNKLNTTTLSHDTLNVKLTQLHMHALKAWHDLPDNFAREKSEIAQILLILVQSWKALGNELFAKGRNTDAIDAYTKALEIYNIPTLQPTIGNNILPIYSNLIVTQIKEKLYQEAIATAQPALEIFQQSTADFPTNLYEKIAFNSIKALTTQAQELFSAQNIEEASCLHRKARFVMTMHKAAFSDRIFSQVLESIESLQPKLVTSPRSEQLQSFSIFPAKRGTEGRNESDEKVAKVAPSI